LVNGDTFKWLDVHSFLLFFLFHAPVVAPQASDPLWSQEEWSLLSVQIQQQVINEIRHFEITMITREKITPLAVVGQIYCLQIITKSQNL
jgi:hypothetical protein